MNKCTGDILKYLIENNKTNQREISEGLGISLGVVNKNLKELCKDNYIDENYHILLRAKTVINDNKPQNAIILAAGSGMRMVPINLEVSKGLLEVRGEPLIERLIHQLHDVGICEIIIVVGFMKEQYEYLIDEYGVELVVNSEYASKNNLYSLSLVKDRICNSYIVPCNIWCKNNPFSTFELYPWYVVTDELTKTSDVRINKKNELVCRTKNELGNSMVGIAFLSGNQSEIIKNRLDILSNDIKYNNSFWEQVLYDDNDKCIIWPKLMNKSEVFEINTYEQLKEIDSESNHLKSDALDIICEVFNVNIEDIRNINVLKKGMTNRSFLFSINDERYIMRIPGEGTDNLINRKEEAEVYNTINSKKICDDILFIDADSGFKITKYIEHARVCNPENQDDLEKCMQRLKEFHGMKLKVSHRFDIFKQIEYYESLWDNKKSIYRDYKNTKRNILSLKDFIENNKTEEVLTHIDAVPDNFLITDLDDKTEIRLIDWEYAGMQDPHVDIAMFCIYSLYDRKQIDNLIDIYFDNMCENNTRKKIYCYIACCGLLWSNWCEYKRNLGVEFGEYSLKQYRYAKEYYRIATDMMSEI